MNSQADCIFCKIVSGEIPSKKVYEDELCCAFYDLAPQTPVHILVVPRSHIASAAELTPENSAVVAHIFTVIARLAAELSLTGGYRVVTNSGADARQSVRHLHFHLLAGREMSETMS